MLNVLNAFTTISVGAVHGESKQKIARLYLARCILSVQLVSVLMMTEPLIGIHHNLPNEAYRDAPGDSATFLKACLRSVKHALTTRKPTTATNTGLRLHEYVLERDSFITRYVAYPDPNDHSEALNGAEQLRSAINALNETRLPIIKTTGSRYKLLESIVADDPEHLKGVIDQSKLSIQDLKDRIQFINSNPNRGLLSTGGTIKELTERLRDAGYKGEIWSEIIERFESEHSDRIILPHDEYHKYNAIYESLIDHLSAAADDQPLMRWLLYAFTTPGVMETEVSVFSSVGKCRLDGRFMAGSKRVGIELKSTIDASDSAFERQASRLHYDLQVGHYDAVCADAGEPVDIWLVIAIEPEVPHGVNILIPDDDFILTGRKKLAYAKRKYREWLAKGDGTVYTPVVKSLGSPAWAGYGPWDDEDV